MALLLASALNINAYVLPGPVVAPVRANVVMRHQYDVGVTGTATPPVYDEDATRDSSTLLRGAVVPTKAPSSGFTLTMAGGHRDRSDVIKAQKKAVKGYLGADDIGDGLPDDIKRYGKGWMNAGGQGGWTSAK